MGRAGICEEHGGYLCHLMILDCLFHSCSCCCTSVCWWIGKSCRHFRFRSQVGLGKFGKVNSLLLLSIEVSEERSKTLLQSVERILVYQPVDLLHFSLLAHSICSNTDSISIVSLLRRSTSSYSSGFAKCFPIRYFRSNFSIFFILSNRNESII